VKLARAPFPQGFRRVAVAQLDRAASAAKALASGDDEEPLHDFRVSLRRLATALKAYRKELGGAVPRKTVRRLKKIFSSTNPARDAQVELAWLSEFQKEADAREQPTLGEIARKLRDRRREGRRRLLKKGLRRFRKLDEKLRKRLARLDRSEATSSRFQDVARPVLRRAARKTQRRLEALRGRADAESLHRARIAVKRLRYLLEPFAPESREAKAAVSRLRELQTFLGDIHDRDLMAREMREPSLARPMLKLRSERRSLFEKARAAAPGLTWRGQL